MLSATLVRHVQVVAPLQKILNNLHCICTIITFSTMALPTSSLSTAEISYIVDGLTHPSNPTRADGRQLLQPLPIEISYSDAPQASGSARVRLGHTEVLAGVRLEVEDVDLQGKGKQKAGWSGKVEVDVWVV